MWLSKYFQVHQFTVIKVNLNKSYIDTSIILGSKTAATLAQGEPKQPNIKTDIPGPESKKLIDELNSINVMG